MVLSAISAPFGRTTERIGLAGRPGGVRPL
jgi:hypothetical protein